MTVETDLVGLTANVLAAYVQRNHVSPAEIPVVTKAIADALSAVGQAPATEAEPESTAAPEARALTPAQIRKSITPEALISFEDGRAYKTLKRHLSTRGLTPEQYREKWGLKPDYPMTSPAYSEARSTMAKALGLGRKATTMQAPAPKRGRKPAKANGE